MIRSVLMCTCLAVMMTSHAQAQQPQSQCEELVALFMELAERSGDAVSEEEARAEVLSENPSDEECGMMLALFPKQE